MSSEKQRSREPLDPGVFISPPTLPLDNILT